ncbi:MAG: dTDP-4-dehydrorhamnose 3,5-epimerase [Pseudomonadales bacterium]|nr:dTDP-4-dehydrorhamnose 3,5-epimerase [Pseudomonadales bacterium]
MDIIPTSIAEVICFVPELFRDERGFFMESFRSSWFKEAGLEEMLFLQDNHSCSSKGVLRGLHYQVKQPQGKLVRVISGKVFDVAVDLRQNSATFGHWTGVILSAENRRIIWIPPGFAHGFLVLSDTAESVYKCTNYYTQEHERTLIWNDPDINIEWPLQEIDQIVLSAKDKKGLRLKNATFYSAIL